MKKCFCNYPTYPIITTLTHDTDPSNAGFTSDLLPHLSVFLFCHMGQQYILNPFLGATIPCPNPPKPRNPPE